uniref:Middle protein n=1 Tax=Bat parvovirus TaxID=1514704 RepID=A0A0D3MCD3_9VIRU|nr:middle protein [Bat parvovirus]
MLKLCLSLINFLLCSLLLIIPGIMNMFGLSGLVPVLMGFCLMLLIFLFLLYIFFNALCDFHPGTNFLGYRHQNNFKKTLCTSFIPVVLSFSITLLIWGLFIWMFYFRYDHLHGLDCQIINNGTNLNCTISHT